MMNALNISDTRTIVLTRTERGQGYRFYSAELRSSDGTLIEKIKDEQQYIETVEYLNHLNLGIEIDEYPMDIS